MPNLTTDQAAAVSREGGALLVSAAAGSGKTMVLVERLLRQLEAGHDLTEFLIITYTKAAAAELRGKIAGELNRRMAAAPEDAHLRSQLLRVYQADIKTVDAFCAGLLRENTHLLAREEDRRSLSPDFRTLDEDEAALLRCCNSLERLTAAEFRDFITLLRLTAAETLTGKELLSLQRELERIAEMLRVNVSVRHAVGLLCTYRYEP